VHSIKTIQNELEKEKKKSDYSKTKACVGSPVKVEFDHKVSGTMPRDFTRWARWHLPAEVYYKQWSYAIDIQAARKLADHKVRFSLDK
jgi:hypothetical protein